MGFSGFRAVLLAAQFERRQRRLALLSASIEEDIQKQPGHGGGDLQRMLPIQRRAPRHPLFTDLCMHGV